MTSPGLGWSARFIAWAAVFFCVYWMSSDRYQQGLTAVLQLCLPAVGLGEVVIDRVQIYAPSEIGVYAAMCLASVRTPWRRRLGALAIGAPLLAALELVAVLGMAAAAVHLPKHVGPGVARRLADFPVNTVLLVDASLVWLALLGATEIPFLRSGSRAKESAPRGSRR